MIAGLRRLGGLIALGERGVRDGVADLRRQLGIGPRRAAERPRDARAHAVLQSRGEWQAARREARRLGLPVHRDPPKTWDTLLALSAILRCAPPGGRVLDAGGERYSALLPALERHGYRDLWAINPAFRRASRRGVIRLCPGDAAHTGWPAGSVHALAWLSVVEHGVDLDAVFAEAGRLLAPGGALVISTDYWPAPIDTRGVTAYGAPVTVFDAAAITGWFTRAARHGLAPAAALPPELFAAIPAERAVTWQRFGLRYTFAFVSFLRTLR